MPCTCFALQYYLLCGHSPWNYYLYSYFVVMTLLLPCRNGKNIIFFFVSVFIKLLTFLYQIKSGDCQPLHAFLSLLGEHEGVFLQILNCEKMIFKRINNFCIKYSTLILLQLNVTT